MFERPQRGERVLLVHVGFHDTTSTADVEEFIDLAKSAGADVVDCLILSRTSPEPKYLIGSGKVDEIKSLVASDEIQLVIFNHDLSPAQERNLEKVFSCRVIDRTGLILDIFATRARTFEGKLQVELAQLQHLSTRLIRGWTHLERQKGGIGLRGPGETQLESDRRLLRERIKVISERLEKVRLQRAQSRRARYRQAIPTVSLVGYTNAGKSTLFNVLTGADVIAEDKLFATLDPTMRRIDLPRSRDCVLADTVGFIKDLPPDLIEAFRATLEETRDSSLILHVIDISDPAYLEHIQEVNTVLQVIGANHLPVLRVYNKIDRIEALTPDMVLGSDGKPMYVHCSAVSKAGLSELAEAIALHLYGDPITRTVYLKPEEGRLRARLYEMGVVLSEILDENGGSTLSLCLSQQDFESLFPQVSLHSEID